MAVEAVHSDVEFAVGAPADAEILGVEAEVADAGGQRHPFQALRDAAPERTRVADGLGVVALIVGRLDVGLCGQGLGDGLELGHGGSSSGTWPWPVAAMPERKDGVMGTRVEA